MAKTKNRFSRVFLSKKRQSKLKLFRNLKIQNIIMDIMIICLKRKCQKIARILNKRKKKSFGRSEPIDD
jgi:hypothetical protein